MADSKHVDPSDKHGLMVAAMAYRVKYRKMGSDGKAVKIAVRIENMGVHKKNRGSVYPAGVRCKSLCVEVLEAGFVKEEVNHALIVVEEAPVEEIIRGTAVADKVSASAYNIEQSGKDELLASCFLSPYDDVRHTLLSHNHIMLVLRAFLGMAKWDIPANVTKNITFCDSDGRLDIHAIALSANGKELGEIMAEGVQGEVLSWKMDVEQPNAASLISQAQNLPHQTAMRTTELTAVAVLKGEIIVQMGPTLSQTVAFQTVRDRVRAQLHTAADDPDLQEVFEFLISNGVGKNAYVDQLMEWTQTFVDSKKRQLRFSAFAVINKMYDLGVWTKPAVIKRAYRQKPTNGFCPSPEAAWGEFPWPHVQKLEDMLRFFHVSCKDSIDKLKPQSRIQLLGNIDIAAADAFWHAKDPKLKYSGRQIEESLLRQLKKYLAPLGLEEDADHDAQKIKENWNSMAVIGRATWIVFTPAPAPVAQSDAMTITSDVRVIHFDDITGAPVNTQQDFAEPEAPPKWANQKLPWREWYGGIGSNLGELEAERAVALTVLEGLHRTFDVASEPVDVWQGASHIFVTAQRTAKPNDIMLPPCVPKQMKVYTTSEHPFTLPMKITSLPGAGTLANTEDGSGAAADRTTTFFLNPEFTKPRVKEDEAAVAGTTGSGSTAVADSWVWGPPGQETMNPFWAVRRLTQTQLTREVNDTKDGARIPRFNCKIEALVMSAVTVGVVREKAVNTTRSCEVPFLTNSIEVHEGEELILEVQAKSTVVAIKPTRTWKKAFAHDQQTQQKEANKTQARAATATTYA